MREQSGLTPIQAIRAKCLECAGAKKFVRECPAANCSLYPFRMGTNPNRAGIGGKGGFTSTKNPHEMGSRVAVFSGASPENLEAKGKVLASEIEALNGDKWAEEIKAAILRAVVMNR